MTLLAITGVSFGDAMTAQAAGYGKYRVGVENIRDLENTTITMKIGDEKKLDIMMKNYNCDETNNYIWTCSNESIVKMDRTYAEDMNAEELKLHSVKLIALKTGTVTVTAARPSGSEIVSVTVKVTKPKMTAKQKKCKHKFKVTKKATCLRYGMKTCKKCKLQKVIPQKKHNFETVTKEISKLETKAVYVCGGCTCEGRPHDGSFDCPNACEETFDPDVYGSYEAAEQAWSNHRIENSHSTTGNWHFYEVPTGKVVTGYKDVTICKSCGKNKEYLDLINAVNDPDKTIRIDVRSNDNLN